MFNCEQKGDAQGGSENKDDYKKKPDPNYCDKGGHRERSEANSPSHKDHWKKEGKK